MWPTTRQASEVTLPAKKHNKRFEMRFNLPVARFPSHHPLMGHPLPMPPALRLRTLPSWTISGQLSDRSD